MIVLGLLFLTDHPPTILWEPLSLRLEGSVVSITDCLFQDGWHNCVNVPFPPQLLILVRFRFDSKKGRVRVEEECVGKLFVSKVARPDHTEVEKNSLKFIWVGIGKVHEPYTTSKLFLSGIL